MQETENISEHLTRQELLAFHAHYESNMRDRINFCYQYLNFYIGLLSAILAATLTGLLTIKFGDRRVIALLLGPLLTLVFARIGYLSVKAFYSSYTRSWVTRANIEAMLGIRFAERIDTGKYHPVYPSQYGGFVPRIESKSIEEVIKKTQDDQEDPKKQWSAEQVMQELVKVGDTLVYAKYTFASFGLASIILAVFILWAAFP
ncbi:MAG: hypothetical protein JOZ18_06895 [Chloroflexi bacterium]|nr:hypothetical protein [Chloroflexota bacterium]